MCPIPQRAIKKGQNNLALFFFFEEQQLVAAFLPYLFVIQYKAAFLPRQPIGNPTVKASFIVPLLFLDYLMSLKNSCSQNYKEALIRSPSLTRYLPSTVFSLWYLPSGKSVIKRFTHLRATGT